MQVTGNRAEGNSTNFYGNIGDVHFSSGLDQYISDKCLQDLLLTDPRVDKRRILSEKGEDKLLQECYTWVLDDPEFRLWRTREESKLLWMKGDPGKGKTMMMMGLINALPVVSDTVPFQKFTATANGGQAKLRASPTGFLFLSKYPTRAE